MCYTLQFSILCLVLHRRHIFSYFFFFNDTATTEIYTLSLHDALPISDLPAGKYQVKVARPGFQAFSQTVAIEESRSEEHTSELQSRLHLVCRLLLEKKKKKKKHTSLYMHNKADSRLLPHQRVVVT